MALAPTHVEALKQVICTSLATAGARAHANDARANDLAGPQASHEVIPSNSIDPILLLLLVLILMDE